MIYLPSNSLLWATVTPKTHLISNLLTYLEYPKFRFLLTLCSHHTRGRGEGKYHKGLLFLKKFSSMAWSFYLSQSPSLVSGYKEEAVSSHCLYSAIRRGKSPICSLSGGQFQKGTELVAFFRETRDPFSAWANLSWGPSKGRGHHYSGTCQKPQCTEISVWAQASLWIYLPTVGFTMLFGLEAAHGG